MSDLDWYHRLGRDVQTDYVGLFNAKEKLVEVVAALEAELSRLKEAAKELLTTLNEMAVHPQNTKTGKTAVDALAGLVEGQEGT